MFLVFSGFRFPICHFPTIQASASDLYILTWEVINMLQVFGFTVRYISTDGAQTNRDFARILLGDFKSETVSTMKIPNIYCPTNPPIVFIMDYSHVVKKIRNNILKSTSSSNGKRRLFVNGHYILWRHFYDAYLWDTSHNPLPVHHKLTIEHFELTSETKMRNKLAEDVLGKEMLHLMQCYGNTLQNPSHLQSTIQLLQNTSQLIDIFRDHRPIIDTSDERLATLKKILDWFKNWEEEVNSDDSLKQKDTFLISHQTRSDICSLIIGFRELCIDKLRSSATTIVPCRINSDVIENVFSQQRGLYNGNNTNPNFLTYCRTMNAIIIGQPSISRKSNTGGGSTGANPFNTY